MLYYISLDIPNTSMFPCFAETKSPYLHVLFSTCLKWTRRILDLNCQVTFGCAICQRNYIGMSLCTFLSYFYPYLLSTMYIWTDFDLCWTDNLQIIVLSFAKLVLCQISLELVHESIVFSCLFPFLNGQKSIYCFKRQKEKR